MSFGWSAGDIVAALQLVRKVAITLKDASGASRDYQDVSSFLNVLAVTLQHLSALHSASLDPNLSQNLTQLCEQVHAPLTTFCEQIQTNFEKSLGSESKRLKFLTTGRKLQWALSTSKKVKDLREKIAGPISAIGLVLGQQIVQNTLQMPFEIQARIAHTIDTVTSTKILPMTLAVQKEVETLSTVQRTSSAAVEGMIKSIETRTALEIRKHGQEITLDLRDGLNKFSVIQKTSSEHFDKLQGQLLKSLNTVKNSTKETHATSMEGNEMIAALSTNHTKTTDLILRTILENGNKTTAKTKIDLKQQTLSLHQKLNSMNFLMEAVKDRVADLSVVQQSANTRRSNSGIEEAIQNIQQSVWLLLSGLHVLIRELIYIIAPYIALLYRTSIQPLLLCGDHFLFEDGIGRRKWLPCIQFQHWDVNFYKLLINTFQGEVGLTRVLNGQFMVLNGFNEVPISKKAWRAGIQPKSRVSMAFMLEAAMIRNGRCANPSCPGEVEFESEEVTRICPVCKKHISKLPDDPGENAEYSSETAFNFDFGSEIHMPIPEEGKKEQRKKSSVRSPKSQISSQVLDHDIAAYKRVIWQASNKNQVLEEPIPDKDPSLGLLSLPHQNRNHRRRGFKGKQKPTLRTHQRGQLKPEQQTKETQTEKFSYHDLPRPGRLFNFMTSLLREQDEADYMQPEYQTKETQTETFICRDHECPRHAIGFRTSFARDQHEVDHIKPLTCSNPLYDCFGLRFITKEAWDNHQQYHLLFPR